MHSLRILPFTRITCVLFALVCLTGVLTLSNNSVPMLEPSVAASQDDRFNPIEGDESPDEVFEDEIVFDEEDEDEDREWSDDDEYENGDGLEREEEFDEMEFHLTEVETNLRRVQIMERLAKIASDDVAMASYAIMHMDELIEDEGQGIILLKEVIASEKVSRPVKNLLKMKLAEIYLWSDENEAAMDLFKSMLMSE